MLRCTAPAVCLLTYDIVAISGRMAVAERAWNAHVEAFTTHYVVPLNLASLEDAYPQSIVPLLLLHFKLRGLVFRPLASPSPPERNPSFVILLLL